MNMNYCVAIINIIFSIFILSIFSAEDREAFSYIRATAFLFMIVNIALTLFIALSTTTWGD